MTFKLVQAKDQTRLPCQFGANPFSGSRDISYTSKKTEKQNLSQFTVCGKNWHRHDLYPATIAQQESMLPFCQGVSQQHCLEEAVLAYPLAQH